MPDITMCEGLMCPKRQSCWRYTATASKYLQSYFVTPPVKQDGTCEHYWHDDRFKKPLDLNPKSICIKKGSVRFMDGIE